jgi:hypothetical protein
LDPREWQAFERLVAAIHHATAEDAIVKWNDIIDGRQFDVTIRFQHGLYSFLTVIECKALKGRVPVKEIEAFVTKAKDVSANKAVVASTSGFQEGCQQVARRHGVTLLTINDTVDIPAEALSDETVEAVSIWDVRFQLESGDDYILDDRDGKLHWLVNETIVIHDRGWSTLKQIIDRLVARRGESITAEEETIAFEFQNLVTVRPPDHDGGLFARAVSFRAALRAARELKGLGLEPSSVGRAYVIRDELANMTKTVPARGLKVGLGSPPIQGRFYYSPALGYSYYCSAVRGEMVHWVLVESYQHGKLIQVSYTQTLEHADKYLEIKDPTEIGRLNRMLDKLGLK